MSETKQEATPGPWEWYDFGNDWCLVSRTRHVPVVLAGNDHGRITTRDANGVLQPITPDHPNARLIAAAPDLLAFLLREEKFRVEVDDCPVCGVVQEYCEKHWEAYGDICDARHAVIAKAEPKL